MADSSVLLEVIVEGKNIKVVQKDVDKLAKSVNKTGQAHENASGKQDKFNKGAKPLPTTLLISERIVLPSSAL